jgi:hypothetical protein
MSHQQDWLIRGYGNSQDVIHLIFHRRTDFDAVRDSVGPAVETQHTKPVREVSGDPFPRLRVATTWVHNQDGSSLALLGH